MWPFKKKDQKTKEEEDLGRLISLGKASVEDIISPAAFENHPSWLQLNNKLVRGFYVYTYPRYLNTNWLSPIIDLDITADIAIYIHPLESSGVMKNLRTQIGRLESAYTIEREKGLARDPELETAIGDIEMLRDTLQRGEERLFRIGLYFTIYTDTLEELNLITRQLESALGGILTYTKPALFQQSEAFQTTLPLLTDELDVLRNLDTGATSTSFPFTSSTLSSNEGVLYGINKHNNSLIIYDRFNLENANAVVFAKSGAGKSYTIKLESLRAMMFGDDIIVIDPENEYRPLTEAVGGAYLEISLNSKFRINPFDLPISSLDEDQGQDVLRSAIISLHGLIALMIGGKVTAEEDALIDRALYETYALRDITADPKTHENPPPVLSDFVAILESIRGAESIASRLSKFTEGTFAGLFNQPTNIDLNRSLVTFSLRNLEEELQPTAMYMILNFIWTKIRQGLKRRVMVVDEAWWLMQYEQSARFLYGLAKRARKYYLGLTVISQDIEDFLDNKYGRAIVANSSLQILLKQSPTSVKKVAEVFSLTEGEKLLLLQADIGEGLFFAGLNHVFMRVVASYTEDQIITTDPRQLLEQRMNEVDRPEADRPTEERPAVQSVG